MALGKLKFLSRLHCKVHWRGLSSGWKIMSAIMTFVKSININDFFPLSCLTKLSFGLC